MLSSIQKLFSTISSESYPKDDIDLKHKVALVLMIEVARSDGIFDQNERKQIASTIARKWKSDSNLINELINSAEIEQDLSTSLFEHTRIINKYFSNIEKITLIDCLWEIAFADGNLDRFEDHTIRKIADLIYVEHQEFMKSKIRMRDMVKRFE